MALHIFYDNSNIYGGAQDMRGDVEPEVPWFAFRLHFENLFSAVIQGRPVGVRILGGSVPPECEELWQCARKLGFDTKLLKRVERGDGKMGEQGVDEVLHMHILMAILDNPGSQTLALVTGDGKKSEFGDGFSGQAKRALAAGWDVEVWSWSRQTNKCYAKLAKDPGGKLKVHHLDNLYYSITYAKGGKDFFEIDDKGKKVFIEIPERQAKPLPKARK